MPCYFCQHLLRLGLHHHGEGHSLPEAFSCPFLSWPLGMSPMTEAVSHAGRTHFSTTVFVDPRSGAALDRAGLSAPSFQQCSLWVSVTFQWFSQIQTSLLLYLLWFDLQKVQMMVSIFQQESILKYLKGVYTSFRYNAHLIDYSIPEASLSHVLRNQKIHMTCRLWWYSLYCGCVEPTCSVSKVCRALGRVGRGMDTGRDWSGWEAWAARPGSYSPIFLRKHHSPAF